jgi:hypothetical protein
LRTVAVTTLSSPGVRLAVGGSSRSCAGAAGGGGGGCTTWISTAPLSQVAPEGRGRPRWSTAGQPVALPPSMAGLPG